MPMGRVYGYIRVMSEDMDVEAQAYMLREMQVMDKDIFIDFIDGQDGGGEALQYERLLKKLREKDLLYMQSLDMLGDGYAARYVAKNIVAAGLADKCEIQLAYAIGVAQPTSVMVDTFGTGKLSEEKLVQIIREHFDLRPAGIIKMLDLRRPIYKDTAAYGHFGRSDLNLPWEALDKVEDLKKYL